jgi:hypothetical protein
MIHIHPQAIHAYFPNEEAVKLHIVKNGTRARCIISEAIEVNSCLSLSAQSCGFDRRYLRKFGSASPLKTENFSPKSI